MAFYTGPVSRSSQTFSSRAQSAIEVGSKTVGWGINSNKWDAETNPDGYVSVGIAENVMLHDKLLNYLNTRTELPTKYLTYNEGSMGSTHLRKGISHFLNRHLKPYRSIEPNHVIPTNGVSSAIEHLSWAFMDPGDGVLLGRPYYGTFVPDINLRPRATVVPVSFGDTDPLGVDAIDRYEEALLTFEHQTGKRVRAVMLCHPHNPLGRCYTHSALVEMMKFCQAHQLHLISDEIYALSVWENKSDTDVETVPFESILSINPAALIDPDLVHVLWGMSKDFGASGLRVGVIISQSNPDLYTAMAALSMYSFASGPSDYMVGELLGDDAFTDDYVRQNRAAISACHAHVAQHLRRHGIEYERGANAGLFVWIDLGRKYLELHPDVARVAESTLTETIMDKLLAKKVYLASGTAFGSERPGWFRFIFTHPAAHVDEAVRRVVAALED